MGEDTPYTVKNNHIIELLKDARGGERSARFVCVIACVMPDGNVITTRGTIEGQIGYEEKGENGFGYDPIFYLPEKDWLHTSSAFWIKPQRPCTYGDV